MTLDADQTLYAPRLRSGVPFPEITLPLFGGGEATLAQPSEGHDWRIVIVYRGKHCPICTKVLIELKEQVATLSEAGVDVIAVSGDPEEKVAIQMADVQPNFPVAYGMSIAEMQALGLYISNPRSEAETDRPFPEPGFFAINAAGEVHIVDISNAPFARPDLARMVSGIKFIREKDYPIRGTY